MSARGARAALMKRALLAVGARTPWRGGRTAARATRLPETRRERRAGERAGDMVVQDKVQ